MARKTPLVFVFACILFALAVTLYAQADMKDMLLNYGFERVRLTNAGKSRIIDFIRQNDLDSLQIVMHFCDSINSPNKDWLSNPERFFIEVIRENWPLLKKDSLYKASFHLTDTNPTDEYNPPYLYGRERFRLEQEGYWRSGECLNPSPTPANEDLFQFLNLTYKAKLLKLRATMPAESYMWDFFELLFPREESDSRSGRKPVARDYLLKYPTSPFYKLVLYNYFFRYKPSGSGAIVGAGGGYLSFDKKTSALLQDRPNGDFYVDIYIKHVPLKFGFTVMTQGLNSALIEGKDTLPAGTQVTNMSWIVGTGYLFRLADQLHITPYAGLSIFAGFLSDSAKKQANADPTIPNLFGAQIGTTIDYQFVKPDDGRFNSFSDISLLGGRLDVGVMLHDFSRLKAGLGNVGVYFNIGMDVMGFGRDRIFEVGTDRKSVV
jgi:hypothetical protein